MESYHHKVIKSFNLQGDIYDDSAIVRLRKEYAILLRTEMRLSGYVPRTDISQDFTIEYNEKSKIFNFKLTIYGSYIGKKKSEWVLGLDGSKPIYTQKIKSNEFSRDQASQ
jgi:hypothetical protein